MPESRVRIIVDADDKATSTFDSVRGSIDKLGKAMLGLAAGGAAALGAGIASTIQPAKEFQSQIAILSTAAGEGAPALDRLRQAALAVGADTDLVGVSASGAAESLTGLYKAGLSTTEIFGDMEGYLSGTAKLSGAMRAAVDAAAASELDMVQASELAVVALSSFGSHLETEAERAEFINTALDHMVRSADASVASVSGLSEALKNVGPTASALGIGIEDTNTALAMLSTRGIVGAEAGTALKSMLNNMQRQTSAVTEAWDALGVALYDAEGQFRGLPTIMADMQSAMAGMTQEQRNQTVLTIAGNYGMNAMNTLLAEGKEGWDNLTTGIAGATSMQDTAAARTATLSGTWEAFMGVIESFAIEIGSALVPVLDTLVTHFASLAEQYGPMVTDAMNLIGDALGNIVANIEDGMSPLDAFIEAMGGLLPEAVISGLISFRDDVLPGLINVFNDVVASVVEWEDVMIALGVVVGIVLAPMIATILQIVVVFAAIVAAVTALRTAWETNFLGIRQVVDSIWQGIQDFVEGIKRLFSGDIEGAMESFRSAFQNSLDAVITLVGNIAEEIGPTLRRWWDAFTNWVKTTDFKKLGLDIIDAVIKGLQRFIILVSPTLTSWFNKFTNWVKSINWRQVGEDVVTAILEGLEWMATELPKLLEEWKNKFFTWVGEIKWSEGGEDIVAGLVEGIINATQSVKDAVEDLAQGAWDAITGFFESRSPSQLMSRLGRWLDEGLALGITKNAGIPVDAILGMADDVRTEGVKAFAEAVSAVVDAIAPTIEALTLLAGLQIPEVRGTFDELRIQMHFMVESLGDTAWRITKDGVQRGREMADAISAVVGMIGDAVDNLEKLRGWTIPNIRPQIDALLAYTRYLTRNLADIADNFEQSVLSRAAAFTESVKALLTIIKPGVDALSAIREYTAIEGLQTIIESFAADLELVAVELMWAIQKATLHLDAVYERTGTMAGHINGILQVIKPAVDALASIRDYTGTDNLATALDLFISDLTAATIEMMWALQSATLHLDSVYARVGEMSGHVKNILSVIKPAIDAITSLGEYISAEGLTESVERFSNDFVTAIEEIVTTINDSSLISSEAVETVSALYTNLKAIVDLIKPGIDVLAGLAEYEPLTNARTVGLVFGAELAQIIKEISQALSDMFEDSDEALIAANSVSEKLKAIIDVIKPGIDALAQLGEYEALGNARTVGLVFSAELLQIVRELSDRINEMTPEAQEAVNSAAQAAEAIKSLVAVIKPGIDALVALFGYASIPQLQNSVDRFADDLVIVVEALKSAFEGANFLADEALAKAGDMAKNIKDILSIVEPALDGEKGALPNMIAYVSDTDLPAKVQLFADDLIGALRILVDTFTESDLATGAGLTKAGDMASSAEDMFKAVSKAVSALNSLAELETVEGLESKVEQWGDTLVAITGTLTADLQTLAEDFGEQIAIAQTTADSLARTVIFIKAAVMELSDIAVLEQPDISPFLTYTLNQAQAIAETFTSAGMTLDGTVLEAIIAFEGRVADVVISIEGMLDALHTLMTANVPGGLQRLLDGMVEALQTTSGPAAEAAQIIVDAVIQVFRDAPWWSVGRNIAYGIANGIRAGIPAIVAASRAAANAALNAAEQEIDAGSPSKESEKRVGIPLVQGVIKAFENIGPLVNAFGGFLNQGLASVQGQASSMTPVMAASAPSAPREIHIHIQGKIENETVIVDLEGPIMRARRGRGVV